MDLSRFSLEGRTAIITGGSGGIGRACALAFAEAGANIVIGSLPPESIPPVVAELEELDAAVLGIALDVSQPEQVDALVQHTLAHFGAIDVLVNVAGGFVQPQSTHPGVLAGAALGPEPRRFHGCL